MAGREHVLGGFLKRITNFDPEKFPQSFDARLIVQKTIYLLQRGFQGNLGYSFSWYLHGPYSPSLAADAYKLVHVYKETPTLEFVDSKLEERFQGFLKFIEPHKRDDEWLELAASMLFSYRKLMRRGKVDPLRIFERMQLKSFLFTPEKCRVVWNELVENGAIVLREEDISS